MISSRAALLYGPGQDYGAGEVSQVGEGVTSVAPGDHVAMAFVPSCGACKMCRKGTAFLCDLGMKLFDTGMITDGRVAHRVGNEPVARYAQLGAFAERQLLAASSVVKVDPDIPWPAVALVSCGVATGFGSAVNRAGVRPGDTVAVLGVGGVGVNAVTAKGGTCVVTSVAPMAQAQADVNLFMLAMMNKEIKGCLYGSGSPQAQIPKLLNLYRAGILKIDELITGTYRLDQVNQGYADIEAGRILRGAITF